MADASLHVMRFIHRRMIAVLGLGDAEGKPQMGDRQFGEGLQTPANLRTLKICSI